MFSAGDDAWVEEGQDEDDCWRPVVQSTPEGWMLVTEGQSTDESDGNESPWAAEEAVGPNAMHPTSASALQERQQSEIVSVVVDVMDIETLQNLHAKAGYERERYAERCSRVSATLQSTIQAFEGGSAQSLGALEVLRRKLQADADFVTKQCTVVNWTEAGINQLAEQILGRTGRAGSRPSLGQGPWRLDSYVTDAVTAAQLLLGKYVLRAGDASIARERIAEFDREADVRRSNDGPSSGHGPPWHHLSEAEQARRAALVHDLHCAVDDAEVLEGQCIARGLDPELVRARRRSSTSGYCAF